MRRTKRELLAFLIAAKDEGKTICGYGAPGKGNTLLNYCGIGPDFLDFTVDRNPYKHGRFTPGMHIPIRPVEALDAARPDYVLILPWNLKDEIIQQMRHVGGLGRQVHRADPRASTVIDPKELRVMKVVLFCGGLGTRIREYSESIPKPMIPVGHQPILWHVMQYYSEYGHTRLHLCLGYKANIIKEFFLNYRPQVYADCVVSGFGANVELLERARGGLARHPDRHRHLAQHRRAPVGGARPRQGRGDVPRQLQRRPDRRQSRRHGRRASSRAASSPASSPCGRRSPTTWPTSTTDGRVREFRSSDRSDIWINGGYFLLRREIFDYMREGEELVLEPFCAPDRGGPADGLQARGLLALDGHAEGPADARGHGRDRARCRGAVGDAAASAARTLSIAGL